MTFSNNGEIQIEFTSNQTYHVSKDFAKDMQLSLLFAFASNSKVEVHTSECNKRNGGFAEFRMIRDESQPIEPGYQMFPPE